MTLMLSENQLKQFDEEGWLFFEDVFDATEVSVLNQEAHRIFAMEREEVFREKKRKSLILKHICLKLVTY